MQGQDAVIFIIIIVRASYLLYPISINTIYLLGGTIKKIDVCDSTLLHHDLYDQVKSPSPSATLLSPLSLSLSPSRPLSISISPSRSIWSPVWGLETWHRRPTTKRFSQFSWWSLQVTNQCSRIISKIDGQQKVKLWLSERQIQLLTRIKRKSTMYPIHANPTKANQSDLWRASLDYLSRTPFQERLKNTTRDIKLFSSLIVRDHIWTCDHDHPANDECHRQIPRHAQQRSRIYEASRGQDDEVKDETV